MFEPDKTYTKNDIYKILSVPVEKQKGAWDTGYREYEGNIYIFANVGIPGRTGSDYNNFWDGDLFHWEAKTNSNINQPLIQKMIAGNLDYNIHLFTRTDNSRPFTYEGRVSPKQVFSEVPVKIIWELQEVSSDYSSQSRLFTEGGIRQVTLNKYERNPLARRFCIEHYGYVCNVCGFDFYKIYGEVGKSFIHIHHIVPLATIEKEYQIDPVKDLIPICPNCHAIIHRSRIPLTISELKKILKNDV